MATELAQAQIEFADTLARPTTDKTRFDPTKDIPNGYQSLGALDTQLTTVVQSIRGIAESDLTLVPLNQLQLALKLLQKILGHFRKAITELSESSPIHSVDSDSLREHYAYKYSIASSVEGFKQQSPEQYKDYVALIAFNELTFNPATQMEAKGSETKHLNPLLDAAMKKMGLAPEQQA
ncbi:hypothetical protein [Bradyrhizobium pachyrhizi]|uniref:hypothetical protein n=1 Tax=Bradyrhizobium pachyrhizi TaxID=280333 RepID=UPI00128F28D8|nr:hypothetical protein [Bradyrhizobium pachyrhizi]